MFVAVDVNNLEIEFAILDDAGKITSRFSISALDKKTGDQYTTEIKNVFDYLKIDKTKINYAAILSSVPKFCHILKDFFIKYIKIEPIIIENSSIPISCDNIDKNDVPTSILSATYATTKLYGQNVVAITFDAITTFGVAVNGSFVGYTIYPGNEILATVIHEKITDYPEIVVQSTNHIFGKNKYSALNCGIFNGSMGACDNIVNGILEEFKNKEFKVVASCKNPELLQYSKTINIIDQDLNIKSIVESAKYQLFAL